MFKNTIIALLLYVIIGSEILIALASSTLDVKYRNLYHSGITSKDIAIASRVITRQIRTNPSLLGCEKSGIPVPEYSITNSKQPSALYYFLACYDSYGNLSSTRIVFEFIIDSLRRDYYNDDTRAKGAINKNVYSIYQEYIHYPNAPMIQYIGSTYGKNMLIRDGTGQVIDSVNAWLIAYPDEEFEKRALKGILGEKWYHP